MKLCYIVNPFSGLVRRQKGLADRLRRWIAEQRLDAALVLTDAPGHATDLARQAVTDGCERVIAVGGDGTVNEVGQGLVGTASALGIVPLGSGNGLARELGLPLKLKLALERTVSGPVRVIDVGYNNGRAFFCTTGTGFDADVVQEFNASAQRGLATYLRIASLRLSRAKPERFTLEGGGARSEFPALFVAVGNASQFGNNAYIAPLAKPDDGVLDLTAIPPVSLWNAAPLVWRLFGKTLDRNRSVRCERAAAFTLSRATPGPWHLDGEIAGVAARFEIRVQPLALRVVV